MNVVRGLTLFAVWFVSSGLPAAAQSADPWLEVRAENFVVYTDTDEEKALRLAARLESVRAAYGQRFYPLAPRPFPIRVVLFDDRDEFQRIIPESVRTELTLTDELVGRHDAYLIQGSTDWFIAARDESPDDLINDVGHSLGHLFLARSGLWRPFWLEEAVGEFVRFVGREEQDDDLAAEDAYPVAEVLEIVPSATFDDLGDGGPFRLSAYFLLRVLMEDHPDVLEAYFRDLAVEDGYQATLPMPSEDLASLNEKVLRFEDRLVPMDDAVVEPAVREMTVEESGVVLGDLALASGYPNVARSYYQQGRGAPGAQVGLAVLGKLGGPSAANARAFEQLAMLYPDDALVHYHLGTLDPDSGTDLDARIQSLERAVEIEPRFGRAFTELGWAYFDDGRLEAAVDAANRGIALEPEYADRAFELIAEARFREGEIDLARRAMETAATLPHIDPSTEEHYRLIVPDLYRRIEARERTADGDRVAALRRQLEIRADEVDPRPQPTPGGAAPFGLVHYEVTSTPPPGVQEPRLVSGDVPEYTTDLRRNRVSGRVALELALDRQGRVESTRVVRSDDERLSEAAVRSVERWRFDPARSEGESTTFSFRILFTFDLQE